MYRFVIEIVKMWCVCVGHDGDQLQDGRGDRVSGCLHYFKLVADEGIEVVIGIIVVG